MSSGHDTPKKLSTSKSATHRLSKDLARDDNAGAVLRTVYQATVEEAVPDDLLDLLGKLN